MPAVAYLGITMVLAVMAIRHACIDAMQAGWIKDRY